MLEDKIFLCVYANSYRGNLVEEFEGGVNRWMTLADFRRKKKRFKSVDEFFDLMEHGILFSERDAYYETQEYQQFAVYCKEWILPILLLSS